MEMNVTKRLLVGQSGGPTAAINSSLLGVIDAALASSEISQVYGAIDGVEGLLEGHVVDLGQESRATLNLLRRTPSAAPDRETPAEPTILQGARRTLAGSTQRS